MQRILIIEDSISFATLVRAHLEQSPNFACTLASSLAETEAVLTRDTFFAAVVDINLPDAPRGEAVDLVREKGIPCIVCTASMDTTLREAIIGKGVSDYVLKQGTQTLDSITQILQQLHENSSFKTLIVDDFQPSLLHLDYLLRIHCFNTLRAASVAEAEAALNHHPDIRLMIIDNHLGDGEGIDLIRKVRTRYDRSTISIIGISGQASSDLPARFLKNGANDFLRKPFLPEEFFCRVDSLTRAMVMLDQLHASNDKNKYLLSMAAHDIRNPVGIIAKASARLSGTKGPSARSAELLEMIKNNSHSVLDLLDTLLELSRIEGGKFEVTMQEMDLGTILQTLAATFADVATAKGIKLSLPVGQAIPVQGDPGLLNQVMSNLISNAIKYSPTNSEVLIQLEGTEKSITFAVSDQGPGIQPSEIGKLFQPFQRLSSIPTGGEKSVGLGLYICKKMIEAHSGQIGYRQNTPHGSVFYFTLPTH